jgi:hypothetical protein
MPVNLRLPQNCHFCHTKTMDYANHSLKLREYMTTHKQDIRKVAKALNVEASSASANAVAMPDGAPRFFNRVGCSLTGAS